MGLYSSDYGSGSSTSSSSSWLCREKSSHQPRQTELSSKSFSYYDLKQRSALDDVMREFQMNGSDSPYYPDEDRAWTTRTVELSGLGPGAPYLRQKSWPEPERSPAAPLPRARPPRPRSLLEPRWTPDATFATSTPVFDDVPPAPFVPEGEGGERGGGALSAAQARALHSLPDGVLFALLRGMRADTRIKLPQECRFCKNNGERQSFYRSHALKDGTGRVACPVLRAFTCRRCGARGDHAHTIKYCPLSTNEERILSAGMMRSVRMASGRRRHSYSPSAAEAADYLQGYAEPAPSVADDNNDGFNADLDPLWAALEQKLSLF